MEFINSLDNSTIKKIKKLDDVKLMSEHIKNKKIKAKKI